MDKKKIWIKANGNSTIATGHLRRCLTIADKLRDMGAEILFVLSDEKSADVLKALSNQDAFVYDSMVLHTDYSKPEDELLILKEAFILNKPDFYLIDSYYVNRGYFDGINTIIKQQRLNVKTGYIDDLYKFDYPVDMIINYDLIVPQDFYSAGVRLLGADYAPLRDQFADNTYEVKEIAGRVLLTSGGTDPYHVLGSILYEIYESDSPCREELDKIGICCDVVIGALFENSYVKELKEFAKAHPQVILHENVGDMAHIMEKADFAVSAGGTTLYELCAVGVPTVVFSMADNQLNFVKAFDDLGAVRYAGDARNDHRLAQKIVTWGTAAVYNKGFRKRMSDKARSLIDGRGAERIAEAILELA